MVRLTVINLVRIRKKLYVCGAGKGSAEAVVYKAYPSARRGAVSVLPLSEWGFLNQMAYNINGGGLKMILYFSGTGNSRHIARVISQITGDERLPLNAEIKRGGTGRFEEADRLVFVAPIYAWRFPLVVEDLLRRSDFTGVKKAWFVATCASDAGAAVNYLKQICSEKGLESMGFAAVVMPDNYMALFGATEAEEAKRIISAADVRAAELARLISRGERFSSAAISFADRVKSSAVNAVFNRFIVGDGKFRTNSGCIGCGLCAELCPLNDIELYGGRPRWLGKCCHCMACIGGCPSAAIEYGSKTVGKERYLLKD